MIIPYYMYIISCTIWYNADNVCPNTYVLTYTEKLSTYLCYIMHDVIYYYAWHKLYMIISYYILSYIYVYKQILLYTILCTQYNIW